MAETSEGDLAWVTDAEQPHVETIRQACAAELAECPADIAHELNIARFLRGHGDVEKATRLFRAAVKHRSELRTNAKYSHIWDAAASGTVDLSLLPHAERIRRHLPFRTVEGASCDGLPVFLGLLRHVDFALVSEVDPAALTEFVSCMSEQRAIVLHARSIAEKRMVKCVEVRDLTQFSMAYAVSCASSLRKIAGLIGVVQDWYPEMVHRVLLFNTPSTISQVMAILAPFLSPRTRSKIVEFPLGQPFAQMGALLHAAALYSWGAQAGEQLRFGELVVPRGSEESAVRWLSQGERVSWSLELLTKGTSMTVRCAFLPAGKASGGGASETVAVVSSEARHTSEFVAAEAGLLRVCLDNTDAWWYDKEVSLTIGAG